MHGKTDLQTKTDQTTVTRSMRETDPWNLTLKYLLHDAIIFEASRVKCISITAWQFILVKCLTIIAVKTLNVKNYHHDLDAHCPLQHGNLF